MPSTRSGRKSNITMPSTRSRRKSGALEFLGMSPSTESEEKLDEKTSSRIPTRSGKKCLSTAKKVKPEDEKSGLVSRYATRSVTTRLSLGANRNLEPNQSQNETGETSESDISDREEENDSGSCNRILFDSNTLVGDDDDDNNDARLLLEDKVALCSGEIRDSLKTIQSLKQCINIHGNTIGDIKGHLGHLYEARDKFLVELKGLSHQFENASKAILDLEVAFKRQHEQNTSEREDATERVLLLQNEISELMEVLSTLTQTSRTESQGLSCRIHSFVETVSKLEGEIKERGLEINYERNKRREMAGGIVALQRKSFKLLEEFSALKGGRTARDLISVISLMASFNLIPVHVMLSEVSKMAHDHEIWTLVVNISSLFPKNMLMTFGIAMAGCIYAFRKSHQ